MPLDDTLRLNKCVLLWKPSVFIVLPKIRNQCKAKTVAYALKGCMVGFLSWDARNI